MLRHGSLYKFRVPLDFALLLARNEDKLHADNAPEECSSDFRYLVANTTPQSAIPSLLIDAAVELAILI